MKFLLAIFIGASLLGGNLSAAEPGEHQRFSIAISGGASKGAYEAGLNWAILKLIAKTESLSNLGGGQIRPIELASVAGASAGGINSILSGLIWCSRAEAEGGISSRINDNVFHDTWLRLDINTLLPPKSNSQAYLEDDALLSRKDYFASAANLVELWRKPAYRSGCRVQLGVTVTRVEPLTLMVEGLEVQNQRFYIPFELRVQKDGSIAYFFDPADYPGLADDPAMILMPRPRNAPEFSIPDQSIIDIATATSAFPAAFGRRKLQYCRLAVGLGATTAESATPESDSDLVCPGGYKLDQAEFADGGLFDNLPVGLARSLAERNINTDKHSFPVTYIYLDPNRLRYEVPDPPDDSACTWDNPPEACLVMDFSLFSEMKLLTGAFGTARRYELYRETTSTNWRYNLSQLAYQLAEIFKEDHPAFDCAKEFPFFDKPVSCDEAIYRSGRLLEIAYDRIKPEILPPYSPAGLVESGVADDCVESTRPAASEPLIECHLDVRRFRDQLADALISITERVKLDNFRLAENIGRSRQSIHDDRILRVSSRGAPITGTLLGSFGSFLEYKFREYDYYVGVYDAIALATRGLCSLQYPPQQQEKEFYLCADKLGKVFYEALGVGDDPRGSYVIARIAEEELARKQLLRFSYTPYVGVNSDMQIIHDGLAKALEEVKRGSSRDRQVFATENIFFAYLKENNFTPTKLADGTEPLLAQIIADPDTWGTEMTRRITTRLTHLERQAADIFAAREPDSSLRSHSYTALMGASAHILQSATYKYPGFTFSPSTAPEDWAWRYIIPYELGFDLVEGDMLITWQPTLAISANNLLNIRASLGFAGGLFENSVDAERENYLGLGIGYIHRTESATISSFGFTPTWYRTWDQPEIGEQTSFGGNIHMSFLKDRLRVGLGARDFDNFDNSWFLTLGISDLPGATYWLTR